MPEPTRDRIQLWVSLPRPPDEVWAEIGGFGAIAEWHPEVRSAEVVEIEGETHRHVRNPDGALSLERLIETGPRYYSYEILDSPLPLSNHRATLSCAPEDGGCRVFWSAVFEPNNPAVDDIVEGYYESGLEALGERYGAGRPAEKRRAGKAG